RVSPMSSGADSRFFKGESELMSTLSFLAEGKQKPVIYFTQGNGELGLEDTSSNDINKGLATIKRQLEADNYTVKGLQLTPLEGTPALGDMVSSVQVPKDAAMVVVAGAKRRLPQHAV